MHHAVEQVRARVKTQRFRRLDIAPYAPFRDVPSTEMPTSDLSPPLTSLQSLHMPTLQLIPVAGGRNRACLRASEFAIGVVSQQL